MIRPMTHHLCVVLVAGMFACAVGAAHAQQTPVPEAQSGQPAAKSAAPAEAPDSQGHDAQTGKPESAHTTAPSPATDGKAVDDKASGKSADETSGKMDDGTTPKPGK